MQLLTLDVRKRLPKLGATAEETDPMVQVKFFYPDFPWTWYGIEFDGTDIFFGYVDTGDDYSELGSFSLAELESNRGKLGCRIERDLYFEPCPLSKVLRSG